MMKKSRLAISLALSSVLWISAATPVSASAEWKHIGYMGDLNNDSTLTVADLLLMSRHLHGKEPLTDENSYHVNNSYIGINGADGFQAGEYFVTADIDQDGEISVFDMIQLRKSLLYSSGLLVWQWSFDNTVIHEDPIEENGEYTEAVANDVFKFMPSHGTGRMLVIYADFPDCKYKYEPSTDEIESLLFGEGNNNALYPWESVASFYNRSSKGAFTLSGKAYRYNSPNSVNNYYKVPGQKALLTEACAALDGIIDFSEYDGNNDGYIDTLLLVVPGQASETTWWPASVQFANDEYSYDGMKIGHMITGNCQIDSYSDYSDFTSTILHETGHCMGLPDYYLYGRDYDYDGFHGTAGSELMDDKGGDLSCVSKLQLGWYKKDQVQVFDNSSGSQTFTLYNAQSSKGNTVIIPCGELDSRYHSEYMMIEYTTKDANNSSPPWYVKMGEGIRVYHVDASLYNNGWWTSFKYANDSEFNDNYNGRRFARIIDDTDTDNIYKTGDIINGSISGFHWYDSYDRETVETGISIEIGAKSDDSYIITIKQN